MFIFDLQRFDDLKQGLRNIITNLNSKIENEYVMSSVVNFTSSDVSDVMSAASLSGGQSSGGSGKPEPTLTVTPNGSDDEQIRANGYTVTYDGDATLMLLCDNYGQLYRLGTLSGGSGTWTLMPYQGGATAMIFTAYVVAPSTDNYTAAVASYRTNIPI